MKPFLYFIVSLSMFSCINRTDRNEKIENAKAGTSESFHFVIDSIFLRQYDTRGLVLFPRPDSFSIEENEEVYELLKTKMIFYEYANYSIDSIKCKILIVGYPSDLKMDGDLRFVYIATLDWNNRLIDFKQIGRYDLISDTYFIVTSEINMDRFKRKTHYEYFIDGEAKVKSAEEDFRIDKKGKIIKIPEFVLNKLNK